MDERMRVASYYFSISVDTYFAGCLSHRSPKNKKLFISFLVINHSCIRRWEKNHFSSPRLVLNPPLITIYLMFVSPCRQSLEYSSGKSASPDPPESFSGEKNHRNLTTQFFFVRSSFIRFPEWIPYLLGCEEIKCWRKINGESLRFWDLLKHFSQDFQKFSFKFAEEFSEHVEMKTC